ncbi:MAG: nicotinate-nucleotide adenylyltransferase [Prevotellaceae bacterium]|jgi:nicotinate-nucleotide adenylyltransferase|nr:nicotinate-nucleotide adenylyltransferase [Prevotellaceae bacterium]
MKRIVLFPGSFNPVHIGHLAVANYVTAYTEVDELWFVVSPCNPHKEPQELALFEHRCAMVRIAVLQTRLPMSVCELEGSLPAPSYTINTLETLSEMYSDVEWSLLMGADNLANFHRWKNHEKIVALCRLLVYPRLGAETILRHGAKLIEAPVMEISSTLVRQAIAQGVNLEAFLPAGVWNYIKRESLYLTDCPQNQP